MYFSVRQFNRDFSRRETPANYAHQNASWLSRREFVSPIRVANSCRQFRVAKHVASFRSPICTSQNTSWIFRSPICTSQNASWIFRSWNRVAKFRSPIRAGGKLIPISLKLLFYLLTKLFKKFKNNPRSEIVHARTRIDAWCTRSGAGSVLIA